MKEREEMELKGGLGSVSGETGGGGVASRAPGGQNVLYFSFVSTVTSQKYS